MKMEAPFYPLIVIYDIDKTGSQKIKLPILEQKIIVEKTCEVSFGLSAKKFRICGGAAPLTISSFSLAVFNPKIRKANT